MVYEDIFDAKNACEHLSGFNVCNRYLVVLYYQPHKVGCHSNDDVTIVLCHHLYSLSYYLKINDLSLIVSSTVVCNIKVIILWTQKCRHSRKWIRSQRRKILISSRQSMVWMLTKNNTRAQLYLSCDCMCVTFRNYFWGNPL